MRSLVTHSTHALTFYWTEINPPSEIEQCSFLLEELVHALANTIEGDNRGPYGMEFHFSDTFEVILQI